MRVVLCDDHHLFTEALAEQLRARGYAVVATVADVGRLGATVAEHRPEVVLLDLGFPDDGCGLDAARALRAGGFRGRVVLCTGETTARLVATGTPVAEALRAGVLDRVVAKTADLPSIEDALHGRKEATPDREPAGFERLTPREVEVLARLAEGLTTAEVADRLGVAPSTVHAHEKSARQRLGVRSRFEAVHQYVGASHGARGTRARARA